MTAGVEEVVAIAPDDVRGGRFTFAAEARSDRGCVRPHNEDSFFAGPRLLAVADGVGGNVGGEIASRAAIDELVRRAELDEPVDPGLADTLHRVATSVDRHVLAVAEADDSLHGMSTTLTALWLHDDQVGVLHVGDSRAYLCRDETFVWVTRDDTLVQNLVDDGHLTRDEARVHPYRSVISQAVGGGTASPTIQVLPAVDGDRYLVCSDGLTDVVPLDVILDQVAHQPADVCADTLVAAAVAAGAPDNVTVVVGHLRPVGPDDGA